MTIKKILAVLLCVAMLAVSFAGCGNDPAPKGDDEYEIAVVVKILGIPFFNVLEEGVKEAAEDLGVNDIVQRHADAAALCGTQNKSGSSLRHADNAIKDLP